MKLNYLFILLIIILLIFSILIFLIMENLELKNTLHEIKIANSLISISNNKTILEKKIISKSNDLRYKIKIYYPYTSHELLNSSIEEKLNTEINTLIEITKKNVISPNQYYTIDVIYDYYNYNNYISYVFYISTYTGGNHPNNNIWSITYDIGNDKIITIHNLVNKYPNILDKLSIETRNALKKDKKFEKDKDIINSMMIDGTKPNKKNFKNFAFSSEVFTVFFEQYQIAPYSYGNFEVTIPYNELFKK